MRETRGLGAALCLDTLQTIVSPSCDLSKQPDLHPLEAAWPPQLLPSSGEGGGERGAAGSGVECSGSAAPWLSLIFSFQLVICKSGILTDSML